jgi:hypothetical protein
MYSMWRRGLLLIPAVAILAACSDSPVSTTNDLRPQFGKGSGQRSTFTFEATTENNVASVTGLTADGLGNYVDAADRVQAYVGVSGKDANLVTYNTPRTLVYSFDTNSAAWAASGIPATFNAVSDFSGINWSMRYQEMSIGSVGLVQGDFEFYVGRLTYELKYFNLAVKRLSQTQWLITTDCLRLDPTGCWNYGFTPSSVADLAVIRRNAQTTYGKVAMPVTFVVTLL